MKKQLFFIFLLGCAMACQAQSGLVISGGNDPQTQSSMTLGQLFASGAFDGGYANEGLQQSFLYRGEDTLLYENSSYPITYRPANRNPQHVDYALPVGLNDSVYLLPTQGLDSLMDVMCYGVTFVNDTTVVAPYSACDHSFALQTPLVLPANSVPPVQYNNNKPASDVYAAGHVTPVTWTFRVADQSLSDIQEVNVKYPPCGTDNFLTYTPAVTTYPFTLPLSESYRATDYEGNNYETVRIGCLCWTKENLKSAKYSDGMDVPGPMVYVSGDYPDTAANFNQYGYLYTWEDAVRAPLATNAGEVQGVCPAGWHVPSSAEFQLLTAYTSPELRTSTYWMTNDGTDLTGFSALPAGLYTGTRFDNLLGETGFWSNGASSTSMVTYCSLTYGCSEMLLQEGNAVTGRSVRCVKGN